MNIRLIFLATLFISCGSEINISNKKLEYNSSLSNGVTVATNQEGVLIRALGSKDKISYNSKSYSVSFYSSHIALQYIASKKMNQEYPVKFKGKIKGDEIVLELLKDK
jgi:hypothetical protein